MCNYAREIKFGTRFCKQTINHNILNNSNREFSCQINYLGFNLNFAWKYGWNTMPTRADTICLVGFYFLKQNKICRNGTFIYSFCTSWHGPSLRAWSFKWIQRIYKSHIIAILCHNLKDILVEKYKFALNVSLPFVAR